MKTVIPTLLVFFLILSSSREALCEEGSDVEVEATTVEFDQGEGRAVFQGQVILRHHSVEIRCNVLTAELDDQGSLVTILATGGVRIISGSIQATAGRAQYIPASGILVLHGQPSVQSSNGVLRGRLIRVDTRNGRVTIEEARGRFRLRSASER